MGCGTSKSAAQLDGKDGEVKQPLLSKPPIIRTQAKEDPPRGKEKHVGFTLAKNQVRASDVSKSTGVTMETQGDRSQQATDTQFSTAMQVKQEQRGRNSSESDSGSTNMTERVRYHETKNSPQLSKRSKQKVQLAPTSHSARLRSVAEETESGSIPALNVHGSAATSTVSTVASSIFPIAGTLTVPQLMQFDGFKFTAVKAESLFDVSSSVEEEEEEGEENETVSLGSDVSDRDIDQQETVCERNSVPEAGKRMEENTTQEHDTFDKSKGIDEESPLRQGSKTNSYPDVFYSNSETRERIVSVSGVTPLVRTLKRGVSKEEITWSEERGAHEDRTGTNTGASGNKPVKQDRRVSLNDRRRSSSQDDDFKTFFNQERRKHRESVTHSELVIKKGKSIHEAARIGNLERMKELIEVNPLMKNAKDERGMTPLQQASSNGHVDCVKWLAVSGVDLAEETPTGYTAMHLAAMNGHVNCMKILSAMGATISCRTIDELSPLHLAAMSGQLECVKWLLASRALTEVIDINQRTPLDVAEEYGHKDVVRLLKRFEKNLLRQGSTLAKLTNPSTESRRTLSVDSVANDDNGLFKAGDSSEGELESDDESGSSNTDVIEKEEASEKITGRQPSGSGLQGMKTFSERRTSVSRNRTDSIVTVEEKKELFLKQKEWMQREGTSFLDSIRMQLENNEET